MNKNTIVVNLMGGPCAGKSTIAAGIFYELKRLGYDVEMALEFAKDKVWEEAYHTLDDQIYIFGKQFHKLWRLNGKVDVIITDSPLLVSLYYSKLNSKCFDDFIMESFNRFNNLTYFINRSEYYNENGRIQNKEEAVEIDSKLQNLMKNHNVSFDIIEQSKAVTDIVKSLIEKL